MTTDFYHSTVEFPLSGVADKHQNKNEIKLSDLLLSEYMTLLNLGTDFVKESKQIKYINICNFIAMTSLLASLVYIALSIIWSNALWFIAVNTLCICSVAVLFLNKIGMINTSRILYLVSVNMLLYIIALIIGPHARSENFLIIAVLIPFLMYDLSQIRYIIIGITLPFVFIIGNFILRERN